MKTLEQLNELSDYEINCAVAEKLGFYALLHENMDDGQLYQLKNKFGKSAVYVQETDDDSFYGKDYCNDPRDYMPIAIEHGISITHTGMNGVTYIVVQQHNGRPISGLQGYEVGRAVCIAFLLMQ